MTMRNLVPTGTLPLPQSTSTGSPTLPVAQLVMNATSSASYHFSGSEQPIFDGGPYSPSHHPLRRVAYLVAGLLVGLAAQMGHALTLVNLPTIAGGLGITQPEAGWLLAAYVAANTSANLLLVRGRVRFGIPSVTLGLLAAYAAMAALQLTWPSFALALGVRIASGFVASALTTITIYYMLQIVPPQKRPVALLVGVSVTQLAVPIARLFPVTILTIGEWQGVHLIELSIALAVMAVLIAAPLPPSIRGEAFEPTDFMTFALAFTGMLMLSGAIAAGRGLWWTDTPWIGAALASAIPLLMLAFLIEHHRKNPLLLTHWIGRGAVLRYLAIALLVRFALAEQTYGAIGLLSATGLNNDQLHTLFLTVLGSMALGVTAAALSWTQSRTFMQILVAALIIALGAWLDGGANNLTRPSQLFLSQGLLGFGACLFIGPALIVGFGQVLQLGRDHFISMVVMFGISQNLGGLLGASLLSTLQAARSKVHAAALSEHLAAGDSQAAARLFQQGAAAVYSALQREANVLAFNDVFQLVVVLAVATALHVACPMILASVRAFRDRVRQSKE